LHGDCHVRDESPCKHRLQRPALSEGFAFPLQLYTFNLQLLLRHLRSRKPRKPTQDSAGIVAFPHFRQVTIHLLLTQPFTA